MGFEIKEYLCMNKCMVGLLLFSAILGFYRNYFFQYEGFWFFIIILIVGIVVFSLTNIVFDLCSIKTK